MKLSYFRAGLDGMICAHNCRMQHASRHELSNQNLAYNRTKSYIRPLEDSGRTQTGLKIERNIKSDESNGLQR